MIPTRPSNNFANIVPEGSEIAVRGYRPHCGKTTLACSIALKASATMSVQVIVDSDVLDERAPFYDFIADSLGYDDTPFLLTDTKQSGYDLTIHDVEAVEAVEEIYYVAPPLYSDKLLGVEDVAGNAFRDAVAANLGARLPEVRLTFIEEAQVDSVNTRWLKLTDWVVLRELERMFLKDTDLGRLRNFLRKSLIHDNMSVGVKL